MSYSPNCFDKIARQQFGNLQHRTFPIYFTISMGLASSLLGLWTYAHPAVLQAWAEPLRVDVFQAYTLTSVILAQGLNYFIIGPMTSKYVYYLLLCSPSTSPWVRGAEEYLLCRCMFERHKLEKEEGKAYNEQGVSDKMKSLNRKFAQLHGWSSLANLSAVIVLILHGLCIGNFGLGNL